VRRKFLSCSDWEWCAETRHPVASFPSRTTMSRKCCGRTTAVAVQATIHASSPRHSYAPITCPGALAPMTDFDRVFWPLPTRRDWPQRSGVLIRPLEPRDASPCDAFVRSHPRHAVTHLRAICTLMPEWRTGLEVSLVAESAVGSGGSSLGPVLGRRQRRQHFPLQRVLRGDGPVPSERLARAHARSHLGPAPGRPGLPGAARSGPEKGCQ
jgi:hypothetical protein